MSHSLLKAFSSHCSYNFQPYDNGFILNFIIGSLKIEAEGKLYYISIRIF